jgi:hypothetical protein
LLLPPKHFWPKGFLAAKTIVIKRILARRFLKSFVISRRTACETSVAVV